MTLPRPHPVVDDPKAQGNFDELFQQFPIVGIRAYGTATLSFTADSTITVAAAHGLAAEPTVAFAVAERTATGILVNCSADFDATNVTIQGTTIDGSTPTADVPVFWFVI